MLGIAIYDELNAQKPNIMDVLSIAVRRKELPINELYTLKSIELSNSGKIPDGVGVFLFSVRNVTEEQISFVKGVRAVKSDAFIVFVTGASKSNIQSLVRPSVGLSGLLFIPPDKAALYQTIREIAHEQATADEADDMFTIKSGGAYYRIPFKSILFFQAQEKRIVAATDKQEISFYASLTEIAGQIPDYFMRSYKSFIVNTKYVVAVNVSSMEISLRNGFKIPLSRQYRNNFKQLMKDGEIVG